MTNPLILIENDIKKEESSKQAKVKIIPKDVCWIMNTFKVTIDR